MTDLGRRIGQRTNLSPANNASWLLAVAILAIVIPANDKIASNLVFFAAHDVSPVAWAVVLVVGLYVFIGNSGVISFGHIGFTCLGAYMTAWLTILPALKKSKLKGLPDIVLNAKLHYGWGLLAATLFAGACAYLIGKVLMRLSGIAASIATFAVLAVIGLVATLVSRWLRQR